MNQGRPTRPMSRCIPHHGSGYGMQNMLSTRLSPATYNVRSAAVKPMALRSPLPAATRTPKRLLTKRRWASSAPLRQSHPLYTPSSILNVADISAPARINAIRRRMSAAISALIEYRSRVSLSNPCIGLKLATVSHGCNLTCSGSAPSSMAVWRRAQARARPPRGASATRSAPP